ncbi:MAG: hypothetical protein II907_05585 [Firmicutes bacterium]|nr:hypothetical protein [Bacillota bacterium]MBQ4410601.1 hypothetical protein [Bacillota bacterium]MBR0050781.1 hypothetical protein [Bacillota bacterium]
MKDYTNLNTTRKEVIRNMILASFGLFVFAVGVYLTIQANIGVAPWDVLNQGLTKRTGFLYGNVMIMVSLTVILLDVLMKEPIGMGMLLDTLVVGKTVDLMNYLNLVKPRQTLWGGVLLLIAGIFLLAVGMRIYMALGLGCGPRDTFLVALCKRFPKLSIGALNVIMWATVTVIGWFLGGQVGLGTIVSVAAMGPVLNTLCKLTRFNAADVVHQNLLKTLKILITGEA